MNSPVISFCTTCKGRLWQLEKTLFRNLLILNENSEIVLLNYQSPDNLEEYIFSNFKKELESGKLKYYSLQNSFSFTMSYAKNVAHKLASGDILFNLDADNYIYLGLQEELSNLRDNEIHIPNYLNLNSKEGCYGRLGYSKKLFYKLNGYDETILGMKADDYDLVQRSLNKFKTKQIQAKRSVSCIQNSKEEKLLYTKRSSSDLPYPPVNYPKTWGKATVLDHNGVLINI